MGRIAAVAAAIVVGIVIVKNLPEITRYVKIRQM